MLDWMAEKFLDLMMIFALMCGGFAILGCCFLAYRDLTKSCIQYEKVAQIGGCDRHGECGVQFSNGDTGIRRYPVLGEEYCVKWD